MGRPINKKFFGVTGGADPNIPARFWNGSASVEGYIVSQKGSNKFRVTADGVNIFVCRLVNEVAPNGDGEMSLVGIQQPGSNPKIIKKITAHKVTDWNNNQYTWDLQDDSTESLLILTSI